MRIVVLHRGYGCESGCCGHSIEIDGREELFDFCHPGSSESSIEFAKDFIASELGHEHVKDLDCGNSYVTYRC